MSLSSSSSSSSSRSSSRSKVEPRSMKELSYEDSLADRKQRERCALRMVALFAVVIIATLVVPAVLISQEKNDEQVPVSIPGTGKEAATILTLSPASAEMNADEQEAYRKACQIFFLKHLVNVTDVQTEVLSQTPVTLNTSFSRHLRRLNVLGKGLETMVKVSGQINFFNSQTTWLNETTLVDIVSKYNADLLREFRGSKVSYLQGVTRAVATDPTPVSPPTMSPTEARLPLESESGQRLCNGLVNLCDIPVNQVLFATMHNANTDANVTSEFAIPNHILGIAPGLKAGIRGINVDIGMCAADDGSAEQLSLVHGRCFLGYSNPMGRFSTIHKFLSDNPHEVILMPSEINDNTGGTVVIEDIYTLMQKVVDKEGKSMADRLYVHSDPNATWPTLGEMIDMDKRIIFMVYNGIQTCSNVECPPGIDDWFKYAAETNFSFASVDAIINDPVDACKITRGSSGTRDFFGINLFLNEPDEKAQTQLNQAEFLQQHIETCAQQNDLMPSMIAVDFWHDGDLIQVVKAYNEALVPSSTTESSSAGS